MTRHEQDRLVRLANEEGRRGTNLVAEVVVCVVLWVVALLGYIVHRML